MFLARFQPGIVVCLLAGCATQPTSPDPRIASGAAVPPAAPAVLMLRIGVEFLPPEQSTPTPAPIADETFQFEPAAAFSSRNRRAEQDPPPPRQEPAVRHTWAMTTSDLAAIDNPIARETLSFVNDLMREDGRAVQREVRLPFLDWQPPDIEGAQLWSEQQTAEAREEWVHEHGPRLLQRPLRNLLRRLPLARDFEVGLAEFRSDNVPLSQPYRLAHGDQGRLGRFSLRLHASDLTDPVELVYIRSGVRIGSSQTRGKVSIDWRLSDWVTLELRGRTDYDTGEQQYRADLTFWPSPTTSLHVSIGDDLDFLSTSSIYSLFDSPMDGSPGILLYAVHSF